MKTIIIGIAGGTGSGKTTLTEKLRDHFGANEVSVLNHDSSTSATTSCPMRSAASSTTTTRTALIRR